MPAVFYWKSPDCPDKVTAKINGVDTPYDILHINRLEFKDWEDKGRVTYLGQGNGNHYWRHTSNPAG